MGVLAAGCPHPELRTAPSAALRIGGCVALRRIGVVGTGDGKIGFEAANRECCYRNAELMTSSFRVIGCPGAPPELRIPAGPQHAARAVPSLSGKSALGWLPAAGRSGCAAGECPA